MASRGQKPLGRDETVAMITGVLGRARLGRTATLVVSGEAGIGKTQLVDHLAAGARTAGDLVVTGHCWPVSGSRPPYGPVVDLVNDLVAQQPALRGQVSPEVHATLGFLLDGPGGPVTAGNPELELTRLAAGSAALLQAASLRQPVVVVLEDLHWADSASTDLLAFWARRFDGHRISLLVTVRATEVPRNSAVRGCLTELRRLAATTDVELGPLPDDVLTRLLRRLPAPPTAAGAERIVALSGGNPFIALHLAIHDDGLTVSTTLRHRLLAPVDALDGADREVLQVLCVLGDAVDPGLAAAATGQDVTRLAKALDRLQAADLLLPGASTLRLRHAVLRDVVLSDLVPSERLLAHARAANGLLALGYDRDDDSAGRLAFHLLEAGRPADALVFAIRGARRAAQRWAFDSAGSLYAAVTRIWAVVPGAEAAAGVALPDLLGEYALALRWSGRLDEAMARLDDALALLPTGRRSRALLHHARGQVLWASGDSRGSLVEYETAADVLADESDDRTRAAVLAALATGYMLTGLARRAVEVAEQAIAVADRSGAQQEAVHATVSRAVALGQLGDFAAARAALVTCVVQARALDDLDLVNRAYGNLTFVLWSAGDYAEVVRVAEEGENVCRRYGPVLAVASTMMNNHVAALIALGRWDEAESLAQDALRETVPRGAAQSLHATLAEIAVARGRFDTMTEHLMRADEMANQDPYSASSLAILRAEAAIWQDRAGEALDIVRAALPVLSEQDDPVPLLNACRVGLRAAADSGQPTLEVWRLARAVSTSGSAAAATVLAACAAEHDRALGRDTASQWLAVADAEAAIGRPFGRAYALFRSAWCGYDQAVVAEATDLATSLDARPLLAALQQLATVEPRPYGLTPREQEVLGLLAAGQTNRAISRQLFISDRTASVHVSNILAKLQVSNRTEAAGLALRAGLTGRSSTS